MLVLEGRLVVAFRMSSRSWLRSVNWCRERGDTYIRVITLVPWGENNFHAIDDIASCLL